MYNLCRSAPISFVFVSLFTSDSFRFFSAPCVFFKAWFCTSQEAGETSESTLIYPNEWLSNSAHPLGTDIIPESEEEKETERQMEEEGRIKKGSKETDVVAEREQRRRDES